MDHKEPDSARNIQTAHEDQEGHPVGRRVMDEWVLCKHRRLVCEERDHQKVYRESGETGGLHATVFQPNQT